MNKNPEKKEPFRITNDDQLAWAAEKSEVYRRQANQYMDMAGQAYEFWLNKANDELDQIQYFNDMISQYADEQRRNNPDWAYTNSPFLRVVWTKPKNKITVSNLKDVINQFKDNSNYVTKEVKRKLDWAKLKKDLKISDDGTVFTEDGEVVNGVKALETPATIQIKHKNDKGRWVVGEKR